MGKGRGGEKQLDPQISFASCKAGEKVSILETAQLKPEDWSLIGFNENLAVDQRLSHPHTQLPPSSTSSILSSETH